MTTATWFMLIGLLHGLPEELALELLHLTLVAVALSIPALKPAIDRYWNEKLHYPLIFQTPALLPVCAQAHR